MKTTHSELLRRAPLVGSGPLCSLRRPEIAVGPRRTGSGRLGRVSFVARALCALCVLACLLASSASSVHSGEGDRNRPLYLARKDPISGEVQLVERLGENETPTTPELAGAIWVPFGLRGVETHDPGKSRCVREIADSELPRIAVRGDFQLFAFDRAAGGMSGIGAVGPWGVQVLLSSADGRYRVVGDGAHVAPGGRHIGIVTRGTDDGVAPAPVEGLEDLALEQTEECLVIVDVSGPIPSAREVLLPAGIHRIEELSLTLTSRSAFFSGRNDEGRWSLFRSPLALPPGADELTAEPVGGTHKVIHPYLANSRTAVVALAGENGNEVDIFVLRDSGDAVNVTSDPQEYLEHTPEVMRVAISDDGQTLAYNLAVGGEPEVFLHDVAQPGPAGRVHITHDGQFNPYIDQESLLFFTSTSLVFAGGHDPVTTDIFRIDVRDWTNIMNLTRTGQLASLHPPFLYKGTLTVRSTVVASGDLLLLDATGFPVGSAESGLEVLSTASGEILSSAIQPAEEATGFFTVGGDLYFKTLSADGTWTLARHRAATLEEVAGATTSTTTPELLVHTTEQAFYYVPGTGILELQPGGEPNLLVGSEQLAPYAAISADGAVLAFGTSTEAGTEYYVVDLSPDGSMVSTGSATQGALLAVGGPSPSFVRGDANRDGSIDISDPITILAFLFTGQAQISCLDAADTNDDGRVQVTDAIVALTFLFQGGEPFAPPYPAIGVDPTPDAIGCPPSS